MVAVGITLGAWRADLLCEDTILSIITCSVWMHTASSHDLRLWNVARIRCREIEVIVRRDVGWREAREPCRLRRRKPLTP